MAKFQLPQQILEYISKQKAGGVDACRPDDITANVEASRPTVNRHLARMLTAGNIEQVGSGPATRYMIAETPNVVLTEKQTPTIDIFRQKYRVLLAEGVRLVVGDGMPIESAVTELHLQNDDQRRFFEILREELALLEPFNCARFRLDIRLTESWIKSGRPGL